MKPLLVMSLHRLALSALTLILVSVIVFSAMELLPGGYAEATLGQTATSEAVEAFNRKLGLDRAAPVRYLEWVGNMLQGELGYSYSGLDGTSRTGVADVIVPRLYNTVFLAAYAAILSVPLALILGVMAALFRNGLFDRLVNAGTLGVIALPEFFVAYLLILVFAVNLRWLPALSTVDDTTTFLEHVARATLPAVTLTLVVLAHMMRMTRAAIVNVLDTAYMEMAGLKGLSPGRMILRHALPNAWGPIATVVALNMAYLIVGVVVVEVVFVYPGIGQLIVDSVSSRNMPVVQACAMIFALTYIILNLLADLVSIGANPRLAHPR